MAVDNGIRTVAFPSISTGIFSYPVEEAAYIAVHAVAEFISENPGKLALVLWACIDNKTQTAYQRALDKASDEQGSGMNRGLVVVSSELDIGDAADFISRSLEYSLEDDDDAPIKYLN